MSLTLIVPVLSATSTTLGVVITRCFVLKSRRMTLMSDSLSQMQDVKVTGRYRANSARSRLNFWQSCDVDRSTTYNHE